MIQKIKDWLKDTREFIVYLWTKRRKIAYAWMLLVASLAVIPFSFPIAAGAWICAFLLHTEASTEWHAEIIARRVTREILTEVFKDMAEQIGEIKKAKDVEHAQGQIETPSLVRLSVGLYADQPITHDMDSLLETFVDSWVNQARQAGLSGVRGVIYKHEDDPVAVPLCVFDTDKLGL